ncbi:MAG: WbqC family protein [Bacteroidales bacterium]|nr:WbqC family protein [Bacteroidales bacterium]MDD3201881.1 WbqC family protein [Bacteroidales bacterium]
MEQVVLTTAYFPPIEYFVAIAGSNKVLIEQCECYQKQSYRSRCRIYSTGGMESLMIPVLRDGTHKVPIRDIKIDYSEAWLIQHQRAIVSAYNSSPFFEYYMDDFFSIMDKKETFLFDLNLKLLQKALELAGLSSCLDFTQSFRVDYPEGDYRNSIQPKYKGDNLLKIYKKEKTYYQVFSNKFGFIPNLSILDLLSNEGPNAISFIL